MNIIENIKRIINSKKSIKEVVNQDFDKIADEKIDNYSSLIDETIEEYKNYIPTEKEIGESINVSNAAPLAIKNGVIYPTDVSLQETTDGYNLLPYENTIFIPTSITWFFLDGTSKAFGNTIGEKTEIKVPVESGKTYTIYVEEISNIATMQLVKEDESAVKSNVYSGYSTFTPDFDGYIIPRIRNSEANVETYVKNVMIYEGTEEKKYEKFTGGQASPNPNYLQEIETIKELTLKIKQGEEVTSIPIDLKGNEMVKLADDVKDKLVIDKKGNISLIKNTKKKIFDGSEDFKYSLASNGINRFYCILDNALKNSGIILSSHFKGNLQNNYSNVFIGSNGAIHFCYDAETVEEFIEFLTNNNVTVYYPLANLEIIPLGNLSQLIKTYKGYNNIWIESNLGTTIELEYYKLEEENIEVIEGE